MNAMSDSARCWLLTVTILAGCASVPAPDACRPGEEPAIVEALYFGTAMPDGRVSSADWERFLADTITPRFPEGLTAWAAAGQWRSPAGELHKEDSYVLHVVHKDEARYDAAVREVIAVYRSRFRQEAVLRVRTASCMSF
jgi:hypothetical protein